jgi:DNA-binding NarL/FixJ family response regulator
MKLLIVDDHVLFREGLVSLLSAYPDFEIVGQASSVREAIDLTRQLHPEVILMDFNLPDGTGAEATRAILAEQPGCAIVFLTIYETDENLFAAIRSGARGYLLKNLPISKLVASLRSLASGEAALSRAMTARLLNEFSRSTPAPESVPNPLNKLSPRELDVLKLISAGASNQEIAKNLFISENTVKHHIHNILDKLELPNRNAAGRLAREYRLT